jgi:aldose 1-epimerase
MRRRMMELGRRCWRWSIRSSLGDECEETVVNVTNHRYHARFSVLFSFHSPLTRHHSYFNLNDASTITGTLATLPSTHHLPVNDHGIPLGAISTFPNITPNTPFELNPLDPEDFTSTIDHCFIASPAKGSSNSPPEPSTISLDTRPCPPTLLVSLSHPSAKIHLEVHSTEPAFQFYTGGGLQQAAWEHGPDWGAGAGFCVEPGRYVNAVNVPEWRNMVVLGRGRVWGCRNIYKGWKG